MNRDFKGVWIPKEIWSLNIPLNDKFYHHYPVSKAHGGTKTVKICPNCHAVYHYVFKED